MDLSIDLTFFSELAGQHPLLISWAIFKSGGWFFVLIAVFWGLWNLWVNWRQGKYDLKRTYILLAIDIPKGEEDVSSPKAVENIFSDLDGAHSKLNFLEKYWEGITQEYFSLELVSIEGYIQFLIRAPTQYRDLVEAAVYSQYPEAEITEVEDYIPGTPDHFPNEEYDLWGTEFVARKDEVYPIRTYPAFEHPLTETFVDPMATLLENMSKIGKGEQIWIQVIITPLDQDSWTSRGVREIKRLIGEEVKVSRNVVDLTVDNFMAGLGGLGDLIIPTPPAVSKRPEEQFYNLMLYLSPGERKVVEAVANKITKTGFKTKVRYIYLGKKEVFTKTRGVHPIIGAFKQYRALDTNNLKPDVKRIGTVADYVFVNLRKNMKKNKIMRAYKARSNWAGARAYVLNIEELATIYHFPTLPVRAPLVKRIEGRRAPPPIGLPMIEEASMREVTKTVKKERAPENLPLE